MNRTHVPGTDCLEVAHESRQIHGRVSGHKQVHMVGFAVEFGDFATPAFRYAFKLFAHLYKHFSRQTFVAAFRHKYDMKIEGESRMPACS